jgi:formate-dependent nitrite reductase cytochrome c552 subunit
VLADQSSAGRPQAGDAEVVQRWKDRLRIVNVHALFSGFAQTVSLRPLIRTQNPAVNIFGEYNRGANSVCCIEYRFWNLNYNAASP